MAMLKLSELGVVKSNRTNPLTLKHLFTRTCGPSGPCGPGAPVGGVGGEEGGGVTFSSSGISNPFGHFGLGVETSY